MSVEIRQHVPGEDTRDFVEAAYAVFEGDPAWVAPLRMVMHEKLDPKKDPFFQHAEVASALLARAEGGCASAAWPA